MPMNALVIKEEFLNKIINGRKRWEIRGSRTNMRGSIALIKSGSGKVFGTAELVDCIGPLKLSQFRANSRKIGIRNSVTKRPYGNKTFAWILENIRELTVPVPYHHPNGAVIWVKLEAKVERRIAR